MTVVADASLLTAALIDSGKTGQWAEAIIATDELVAPSLILVETTNVLRRLERAGHISSIEATGAQRDLLRLDLELFDFEPFAARVWELRNNLTSYDAWYVAIAEALSVALATLDGKLTQAAGPTCEFVMP